MRLERKSLIVTLAKRTGLPQYVVRKIMEELPKLIYETLNDNGEVSIKGFGRFYTTRQARRLVVDLKNHSNKTVIEPTLIPRFTAGLTFKKQIRKARA